MTIEQFIERLLDLRINLQTEVDARLRIVAYDLKAAVVRRSFTQHKGASGTQYPAYTKRYADWKAKYFPSKYMGQETRNFELTGNMKMSFGIFNQSGELTMGFEDSKTEKIAMGNSFGNGKWGGVGENIIEPTEQEIKHAEENFNKSIIKLLKRIIE